MYFAEVAKENEVGSVIGVTICHMLLFSRWPPVLGLQPLCRRDKVQPICTTVEIA
jgi:hypothetical protein